MNHENVDSRRMDLHRRIALVLRKEPRLVRDFAERLRSRFATARDAAVVSDNEWEWYIILTLWSPLQVIRLLVRDPHVGFGKGGLDEALFEGPALFNFRNQCLPFSALDLIPLVGEIGLVQPKLTLGQFFDFRFGVDAGSFFNLPHPIQTQGNLCDPGLSSRHLPLPLSVRFFAGRPARCSLLNGLQLCLL
jgi:hypothetical protein